MKKTLTVGIGNRNFIIDEDAYLRLGAYLDSYKSNNGSAQVTSQIEERMAELFSEKLCGREVIDIFLVDEVAQQIGLSRPSATASYDKPAVHKFYRDPDNKKIAGVCGGIAAYSNTDVTIIRILFLAGLLLAGWGFWLYVIVWILAPEAVTGTQQCELRGIPCTVENIAKFTSCK